MDKLSNLLQEAKPLYRQRKRQKAMLKTVFVLFIPLFALTSIFQIYNMGSEIYISLDNNRLQNELIEDDFGLFR